MYSNAKTHNIMKVSDLFWLKFQCGTSSDDTSVEFWPLLDLCKSLKASLKSYINSAYVLHKKPWNMQQYVILALISQYKIFQHFFDYVGWEIHILDITSIYKLVQCFLSVGLVLYYTVCLENHDHLEFNAPKSQEIIHLSL